MVKIAGPVVIFVAIATVSFFVNQHFAGVQKAVNNVENGGPNVGAFNYQAPGFNPSSIPQPNPIQFQLPPVPKINVPAYQPRMPQISVPTGFPRR
jgi:hypothetical protein